MTACLIIEDDAAARRAMAEVLSRAGFSVHGMNHLVFEAGSEQQASADLILMDLSPPYHQRHDLLLRAMGQNGELPVIVTSTSSDLDTVLGALRLGAMDFLPKPVRPAELSRSADRALQRIARRREVARLSDVARQRVEDLSLFNRISGLIISADPAERWMGSTIEATCGYLQAESGAVLLLDASGSALVPFGHSASAISADSLALTPDNAGIAWACLDGGQALKVDTLPAAGPQAEALGRLLGGPVRNLVAVPIVVQDRAMGVFLLANRVGGQSFEEHDLERLAELASHLAVAVHNATSVIDLKRSRDEMQRLSTELGRVVDERTQALRQLRQANRQVRQDMDRTCEEAQGIRQVLAENERMAVLGLLAAGVSHEINNPLGFVSNNFGVLRDYVRSMYRLAAVMAHASKRMEAGQTDVVVRLAKEAIKVLRDENIPAVMNDIGPLFDETQQGLSRIEVIVDKLHRLAEGSLSDGAPIQVDLLAEFQRLAELVQGSGASPLSIRFEDEGRPVVRVSQMSLRLLLLNLLGHFTRRRTSSNRVLVRTGSVGPLAKLELVVPDESLPDGELACLLSLEPAQSQDGQALASQGLGIAAELAREMGGQLTGLAQAAQGYSLSLLLPSAGVQEPAVARMGG